MRPLSSQAFNQRRGDLYTRLIRLGTVDMEDQDDDGIRN
jgi:hypothetical protein